MKLLRNGSVNTHAEKARNFTAVRDSCYWHAIKMKGVILNYSITLLSPDSVVVEHNLIVAYSHKITSVLYV